MKLKKSLGQHFLKSKSIVHTICKSANLSSEETVLEVGPGQGFLTDELIAESGKVIVLEKDSRLIPFLRGKYAQELASGTLEIHEQDVLSFNPCSMGEPYKLVANIPYYITGKLLRLFLESECQPERMVMMVQKEVAERIVARDNKESILSLSVKAYGKPSIIQKVSRKLFTPPPDVDSAVLLIENISRDFFVEHSLDEKAFFEIVRKAFSQKRKQLGSTILKGNSSPKIDGWKKKRPEDLSLDDWASLIKQI
jgi:16S rRNA (adenine1518-N6/adenine1519-N6)-dimethyltransferase